MGFFCAYIHSTVNSDETRIHVFLSVFIDFGLVVWWFGCLVVWLFGGLVVWSFGGLVVWWFSGLVV